LTYFSFIASLLLGMGL